MMSRSGNRSKLVTVCEGVESFILFAQYTIQHLCCPKLGLLTSGNGLGDHSVFPPLLLKLLLLRLLQVLLLQVLRGHLLRVKERNKIWFNQCCYFINKKFYHAYRAIKLVMLRRVLVHVFPRGLLELMRQLMRLVLAFVVHF